MILDNNKWISVEDELPTYEKHGVYQLVWTRHEDSITDSHITIAYESESEWWTSEEQIEGVTHWMPLPEPPKHHR